MIERTIADIIASLFVVGGLFFLMVGAVGIVRFPDTYNRLHASSKCSTLGLLGLVLGVIFHIGTLTVATKGLLTILFAFVATPVGSHILAKAAHISGAKQWGGTLSDELAEDKPDDYGGGGDGGGSGNGGGGGGDSSSGEDNGDNSGIVTQDEGSKSDFDNKESEGHVPVSSVTF